MIIPIIMLAAAAPAVAPRIPPALIGRYEAESSLCRIPWNRRDDGEESGQGAGLFVVEPRQLYFVEWMWPIRSVKVNDKHSVAVELLNDVNGDGKNVEVMNMRLIVEGSILTVTGTSGSSRYFRCSKRGFEGSGRR